MNNVIKGTNSKILLIGKIKGLADESKRTRQLLLKSKTELRTQQCAYTKRVIGLDIRHHLLAYAFMRGEAYHTLEKKCRPEHQPNAEAILQIVHAQNNNPDDDYCIESKSVDSRWVSAVSKA